MHASSFVRHISRSCNGQLHDDNDLCLMLMVFSSEPGPAYQRLTACSQSEAAAIQETWLLEGVSFIPQLMEACRYIQTSFMITRHVS